MDFILSRIISRSAQSGRDNCDSSSNNSSPDFLHTNQNDNGSYSDNYQSSLDIDTSKSSIGGTHVSGKSPSLESDISGIDADNTLSSGFDTTIDTSYKTENPNVTFSDLISGLGGLKINSVNTPQRLPKPNNYDVNTSLSSDDELFQECENGFDLDATKVISNNAAPVNAHSSNIDYNVFDKTINYSSITANSTAGLGSNVTSDGSLPNENSSFLYKSNIANQTINGESIPNPTIPADIVENALEVPSVESFAKSQDEITVLEEQPANIEFNSTTNSFDEKCDVDQLEMRTRQNATIFVEELLRVESDVAHGSLQIQEDSSIINELTSETNISFIISSEPTKSQNQVISIDIAPEQQENPFNLSEETMNSFELSNVANQTINIEVSSPPITIIENVLEEPSGRKTQEKVTILEKRPAYIAVDGKGDQSAQNTTFMVDEMPTNACKMDQSTSQNPEDSSVDNKVPSESNTSSIISSNPVESPKNQVSSIDAAQQENPFKLPAKPTKTTNPFDLKGLAQNQCDVLDDEFQTPGLILNSNDFDFLLSRGCNSGPNNPRDSILERFDPIIGRKSIVLPSLISKVELVSIAVPPSISTILEVDSINETLVSVNQSPDAKSNEAINECVKSKQIAKLESIENLDVNNISGDGDNSQASSTTETYETASIGEPLKADVTMSIGLIHDLKMDNIKSMEQDKEEPNLKMNDEHKVKQEMVGDIERKLKEAEAREESLLRRITEKEKALNKMSAVVENYEKTMVEMISEREQLTQNYEKQLLQLKTERDANFHHLTSLENTFSDLHVKYEKSKQMAIEVKENEAKLEEKLQFCQQQMNLQEQRYDKLKNHALSQLEGANAKLETLNKAHTNEIKKLSAQLKKEEISRQSIMEQLAQKTKENEELVKICDELINNGADGS